MNKKIKKKNFLFNYFCQEEIVNKEKGLTLAEMLLTIAILGIIATLVLTPLLKRYKMLTFKKAYKKAYSNVVAAASNIAFKNNYLLEGLFDSSDTLKDVFKIQFRYIRDCDEKTSQGTCWASDYYRLNGDKGKMNLICPENSESNVKYSSLLLLDGSSLAFTYKKNKNCDDEGLPNVISSIHIDVNGLKSPNTYGKDIYAVYLFKDGTVRPFGYNATNEVLQTCILPDDPGWDDNSNWGHRCSLDYLLE